MIENKNPEATLSRRRLHTMEKPTSCKRQSELVSESETSFDSSQVGEEGNDDVDINSTHEEDEGERSKFWSKSNS